MAYLVWQAWYTKVRWAMHSNILSKPVGRTVMPMHGWDLDQGKVLVHMVMGSIKCIEFIDKLNDPRPCAMGLGITQGLVYSY